LINVHKYMGGGYPRPLLGGSRPDQPPPPGFKKKPGRVRFTSCFPPVPQVKHIWKVDIWCLIWSIDSHGIPYLIRNKKKGLVSESLTALTNTVTKSAKNPDCAQFFHSPVRSTPSSVVFIFHLYFNTKCNPSFGFCPSSSHQRLLEPNLCFPTWL